MSYNVAHAPVNTRAPLGRLRRSRAECQCLNVGVEAARQSHHAATVSLALKEKLVATRPPQLEFTLAERLVALQERRDRHQRSLPPPTLATKSTADHIAIVAWSGGGWSNSAVSVVLLPLPHLQGGVKFDLTTCFAMKACNPWLIVSK
jgi:hypothetical protein